jgi:hypothetical protein
MGLDGPPTSTHVVPVIARILSESYRRRRREHPAASSRQTPSASTPQQHRQGLERAGSTPNAGNSYRIPTGFDLQQGQGLGQRGQAGRASTDAASGLPWGGVGLEHIIDAGHEAERKRRSKSA